MLVHHGQIQVGKLRHPQPNGILLLAPDPVFFGCTGLSLSLLLFCECDHPSCLTDLSVQQHLQHTASRIAPSICMIVELMECFAWLRGLELMLPLYQQSLEELTLD